MSIKKIQYGGVHKVIQRLCEAVNQLIDNTKEFSQFDADGDGVVDNAAKVNGHTVACDVPADAVFTDTAYDDSELKTAVKANTDALGGHTVKTDVPEGAVFTDTTYTFELSDGKLTIRSSAGTKQVLTLPTSGSGGSSGDVTEVTKPSFDHIKDVAAVTKLALDVDDGNGFVTYKANSAVHLSKASIGKSDPDIRLKVVEVQLSDGTLSTDMDTYNGFRFYATTGKCIVDNGDNGTTSYPDADQIGHFKFASGVANDETTLMAYNQATLKYKYLMVYVED
ncbi:MAG: hypothetical protein LKF15_03050 [Lachnospiraceae bacterium]|jgi:hypothetical protein|nr:hypothetical protein [Lachnospiraceae bacterium]MCH4027932.1 hypothetical protein [Lachnospiraceae bacterium]MCH4065776.1 hypothetical protein [Lachnospiraceae bacterium]MCH4111812.1 hypothetical protein [Lachnospiraceae bacterium]